MTAKGSPAYYAERRQPDRYDRDAELLKRRTAARANGMFDEFSERPAFETWFRESRKGRGATYVGMLFERLPDGSYARPEAQRHWHTWAMSVGAGKQLPPFDPIKIAADRARTAATSTSATTKA
jgi:hypothetical protein